MKIKNKICNKCIYGENVPMISFDDQGICSYCKIHEELEKEYPTGIKGKEKLFSLLNEIKRSGKGKKYDCVVGVSGGCDSSFLLYTIKKYGLRPLAVHFDNTWNSSVATDNIRAITKNLGVDLFTYVVDNKEYDDIYRSFLKAGVRDLEAPTDIGFITTLYKAADKFGLKYIIEGHSFRTEGISPLGWLYMDGKYIESVQKKFGTYRLKTFPNLWMKYFLKWLIVKRIKRVHPLYYIDYQKEKVKKMLDKKLGWSWYGGHHLENRFTKFYHSYFLPRRFGIDQRLLGYAALIRSGQMERSKGLRLMKKPPKEEPDLIELVKKRLGFTSEELEALMKLPKKTYRDFKTYKGTFERYKSLFWILLKLNIVPKSFYIKFTNKDFVENEK